MPKRPHRVVALALPGTVLLDLAAPAHVFGALGGNRYEFVLASLDAGPVGTTSGFPVQAVAGLEALREADTIVVPGYEDIEEPPPPPVLEALRRPGARVMSVCVGAFALAHAGLLDGRRATTHWRAAALLAERFPLIDVDPGVLYVDEGDVLTSAGVAAGLDLCLHVLRRDHGAEAAARAARRMVLAPHRDGGQAQFIDGPFLAAVNGAGASLEPTRTWALERLHEPLDVAAMARHACVSPRTFARRFRAETGTTPLQWLLRERVNAAQRLLERTGEPVETIAARCGFGSAASLRAHFARATSTTPTAYRRSFRAAA